MRLRKVLLFRLPQAPLGRALRLLVRLRRNLEPLHLALQTLGQRRKLQLTRALRGQFGHQLHVAQLQVRPLTSGLDQLGHRPVTVPTGGGGAGLLPKPPADGLFLPFHPGELRSRAQRLLPRHTQLANQLVVLGALGEHPFFGHPNHDVRLPELGLVVQDLLRHLGGPALHVHDHGLLLARPGRGEFHGAVPSLHGRDLPGLQQFHTKIGVAPHVLQLFREADRVELASRAGLGDLVRRRLQDIHDLLLRPGPGGHLQLVDLHLVEPFGLEAGLPHGDVASLRELGPELGLQLAQLDLRLMQEHGLVVLPQHIRTLLSDLQPPLGGLRLLAGSSKRRCLRGPQLLQLRLRSVRSDALVVVELLPLHQDAGR